MITNLKRISTPAPCISLALAKSHCRVDHTDDDVLITGLVEAATSFIEGYDNGFGVYIRPQTWRMTLDKFEPEIKVKLWPAQSIVSINYFDQQGVLTTVPALDYIADLGGDQQRVTPAFGKSWPSARQIIGAVYLDIIVGPNTPPPDLQTAVLLIIGHWYETRETVNIGNITSELPFAATCIIDKYKRGSVY